MDLSVFNTKDSSEEGTWLEVLDYEGEPLCRRAEDGTPIKGTEARILVLGPDSSVAAKIADEETTQTWKRFAASNVKKGKADVSDEPATEKSIRKACKLTKDWKNVEWGKDKFPCTEENKTLLFTKSSYIRNQVLMYYQDLSNFTPVGSPNSKKPSAGASD